MQAAASKSPLRLDLLIVPALIALALCAAIVEAAKSPETTMVIQAWTFTACMAGTAIFFLKRYGGGIPADERVGYANDVIKFGVIAAMFWGIAGMLVGVVIAAQLALPKIMYAGLFSDFQWTNFGDFRPLHTSGVVFAFGGNVLLTTSFYVVQRTCKARLFGGSLALVRDPGLQHVHRAWPARAI